MRRGLRVLAAGGALVLAFPAGTAFAQKQGGILRVPHFDSPASVSLLEESTVAVNRPMMGVFNNLVMFRQDVPQNSLNRHSPDSAGLWGQDRAFARLRQDKRPHRMRSRRSKR